MIPKWSSVCALLYVAVCFNLVAAGHPALYRRQDASSTTTAAATTTRDGDGTTTTAQADKSDTTTGSSKPTSVEITTTSSSSTLEPTIIPSAINGNNPSNESYSDDTTIAAGELPLEPRLTPGWGVSGAILLITGIGYTLIGIKNTWMHTFFSSAYLTSLCVTVLIVYVMSPPVSDAIQGAYVVGVVCSGLILGGAATIFKELTEGLGCLLGGFCFAMWLLTLHEGGLLPTTVGKVIFIIAFTVTGFAFYFSRYTRAYALIVLISFAGATVTVLGIDCFSKAGLKEFWAYIWNLNDNLFPLGADTYPLTKGVRVEIAVIVVLTILGIISQLRLWRVVQQHREKRAEERAEFERMRDEEEATVGRRIEEDNERERRQWETTYGNGPPPMSPTTTSRDSGVGEIENEKKGRLSQTTVQPVSPSESDNENAIEMADLSASTSTASPEAKQADGLGIVKQDEDKRVTIRVSQDDHPDRDGGLSPIPEPDEKSWMAGVDGNARHASVRSRNSQRLSNLPGPEIVPLPFAVPETHGDEIDDEDRSSVATFADEDERSVTLDKRASRASLSHRLSVGSGNLLRSLSHRSQKSKGQTGEFDQPQPSPRWGESGEDLVTHHQRRPEDAGSIAATIDGMSLNDDERIESVEDETSRWTMEIKAELADRLPKEEARPKDKKLQELRQDESKERPYSAADTVATDILNPSYLGEPAGGRSKRSSATHATAITEGTNEASNPNIAPGTTPSDTSKAGKSASSVSLTKDALPSSLSRVALSYRTNEWAKHLSQAEKPELEMLKLNEYVEPEESTKQQEAAAPLYVEELQQTPESGIPAASIVRSPSSMSNAAHIYRSPSRTSVAGTSNIAQAMPLSTPPTGQLPEAGNRSSLTITAPPPVLHTNHSLRMKNRRQSGDVMVQPILEENEHLSVKAHSTREGDDSMLNPISASPVEYESPDLQRTSIPGVVSYTSPQTLIGKRDMFLRSKSQSTLLLSPPIPEGTQFAPRSASQMDLSYNHSPPSPLDADDLPLSQRKELMRQSSMLSAKSATLNPRPNSTMRVSSTPTPNAPGLPQVTSDNSHFNSHQPQRRSTVQSHTQREAQLASFRQSVAAELRANTPVSPSGNNGRETPLVPSSSNGTLLGGGPWTGNNDVQHQIDQQRNMLLSQRQEEAQRKEFQRLEKERNDYAFEEMMRRGDLMDAHREALRKMQKNIKDQ
ncbi:hypothetical protein F4821DRAFT_136831 [Hypoxylon rubiginosum]|uniref:Uncharacterized protein n=1 Tax=Hypoxylon rubiginosum TaxID=110542 RepID=A0ACC0DI70_9PEZI|nr:hypothetical protein F4821DRAFT_136831 [Hypoxylon rubiginosum]